MSLSRRRFLQASGMAMCAGGLPFRVQASDSQLPLPIPPLLESRRGQPVFLSMESVHWAFNGQRKADTCGFNGHYLGPTVKVYNGDDVKLIYSNRLAESVAMEVSGLLVPGAIAGGPARMMSSGVGWSPVMPIRQQAATLWYHSNTPQRMGSQLYKGLAGLLLVEDANSKNLPLPNHYGVDDIPVIIQDKRLDNFGVPIYDDSSTGFLGDHLIVNGVESPYVEVSRGWVRLRLLNASNARRYLLQISDNRPFHLIGNDQGLLQSPITMNSLSIAPGERREVLIDMTKGEEVSITSGESAGIIDRLRGLFEPSSLLVSNVVLTLRPAGLMPLVTDNPANRLAAEPINEGNVVNSRNIVLGTPSSPGINGAIWDLHRTDIQAREGSWEKWTVRADTPQAFYIQGARFLVKSVNNAPPMNEDRGWKDTIWVDGEVSLLVYFPYPTSDHFPFLYYSRNAELADRGDVGQLMVQPAS